MSVMTTAGVVAWYPPYTLVWNPPMVLNPDMASSIMNAMVRVLMMMHMVCPMPNLMVCLMGF